MVKSGRRFLGDATLKSAISQERIVELSWSLAYWYQFKKARIYFNNCWVGVDKMGMVF